MTIRPAETGPSPAGPRTSPAASASTSSCSTRRSARSRSACGPRPPATSTRPASAPSRYFDPEFHRRRGRAGLGPHLADGVPGGADPEVGDSSSTRSPTGRSSWCAPRRDEIRAFHNSCLHRGTQLRTSRAGSTSFRCPYHGFTWNLDGTLARDPVCLGLPAGRRGLVLPPAGAGRHLGRLRVREHRRPGRAARGLPRGPAVALRAVAPRGPLPHRPRRADDAVQLEGGARGVHRGVPHDGGAPAAAPDRRRLADRVRRLRAARQPHDHRRRRQQRAPRSPARRRRDRPGHARLQATPRSPSSRGRTPGQVLGERVRASLRAAHRAATTRTSPTPSSSTASSTSCSRTSCRGPGS